MGRPRDVGDRPAKLVADRSRRVYPENAARRPVIYSPVKGDHSVQAKHQVRTESQPTRREVELDHLLQEVAEDARERAARYPKDTIVPEGGE
jgi:hypothetical protein